MYSVCILVVLPGMHDPASIHDTCKSTCQAALYDLVRYCSAAYRRTYSVRPCSCVFWVRIGTKRGALPRTRLLALSRRVQAASHDLIHSVVVSGGSSYPTQHTPCPTRRTTTSSRNTHQPTYSSPSFAIDGTPIICLGWQ